MFAVAPFAGDILDVRHFQNDFRKHKMPAFSVVFPSICGTRLNAVLSIIVAMVDLKVRPSGFLDVVGSVTRFRIM